MMGVLLTICNNQVGHVFRLFLHISVLEQRTFVIEYGFNWRLSLGERRSAVRLARFEVSILIGVNFDECLFEGYRSRLVIYLRPCPPFASFC